MVINEIITLLDTDKVLNNLLGDKHIFLAPTNYTGEAIIYSWLPVSSDKIKRLDKLEINVITDTQLKGIQIEQRLKEVLLTLGDTPLVPGIHDVNLNGGGNLYDYERQKNHRILYFYITSREDIE